MKPIISPSFMHYFVEALPEKKRIKMKGDRMKDEEKDERMKGGG